MNNSNIILSEEQKEFLLEAEKGSNILVDACIGSGKTTSIQKLCDYLSNDLKILYLTYNKLLKIDAKNKIKNKNVTVTNYHGFAFSCLKKIGISAGLPELVQKFIEKKPPIDNYDILIVDEYQDIELELSLMLDYIKQENPNMQIIAVGDMSQKIYDKTTLDVSEYIKQYLGDFKRIKFTRCFRLSEDIAASLGRIWSKKIIGTNQNCKVERMNLKDVTDVIASYKTNDILCLGSRTGNMVRVLNELEEKYPEKFNKKTVFASIMDSESTGSVEPKNDSAIFTTYDSSKGLERKICVIFDFTENYWKIRSNKPQQSYEILRNIFCVAASRGKDRIIFVESNEKLLSEETLSTSFESSLDFNEIDISKLFDFKYKEDVEKCFQLIETKKIDSVSNDIQVKTYDGLIDLSPCVGIYQEASFFSKYDIEKQIEHYLLCNKNKRTLYDESKKHLSVEEKILFLTSLETEQNRYFEQVQSPYVSDGQKNQIFDRLKQEFSQDENVQIPCDLAFMRDNGKLLFKAIGLADVVKDRAVYELKFVSELMHIHFLQCALYIVALNLEYGVLWNIKNNEKYLIKIPNKKAFLDEVCRTVTKGYMAMYYPNKEIKSMNEKIAVIDCETNRRDEVMSIGVVIADANTFLPIDSKYFILPNESAVGGMFSHALIVKGIQKPEYCSRANAIDGILRLLDSNAIEHIYAYNAKFDYNHLPELSNYQWYDIMRIAAYKQYNPFISTTADCCQTGRLKNHYGVEPIMRMVSSNKKYRETHNALMDAIDELKIMSFIGRKETEYAVAQISKNISKCNCLPVNGVVAREENLQKKYVAQNEVRAVQTNRKIKNCFDKQTNFNFENYYSVSEICNLLKRSKSYVYKLIHNKEMVATKYKNKYYIQKTEFQDYLERLKRQQRETTIAIAITFIVFIIMLIVAVNKY